MDRNKIVDKIRKLFALGDSSRNPNEGEVKTSLAMAHKLMNDYNLSLSEVELKEEQDSVGQVDTESTQKKVFWWERKLAKLIGELFNCHNILNHKWHRTFCWMFIGLKEEAELASKAYEYIHKCIVIMASDKKEKLAFYEGCITRLQERIEEEIKLNTKVENSKCTAIVLVKNELIKKYEEKNLELVSIRNPEYRSRRLSEDFLKGYLAGGKIDLQNREKIN